MRLQHSQHPVNHHTEIVTACCWTPENDAVTCSDDKTIVRWRMDGEVMGKIATVDAYITSIDWAPSIGRQAAETFAVACTDGTFRLMTKAGREEKKVQASDGALISLKWNYDGTALLTAGEDGIIKVWSRSGNLRSTLASTGRPVYAACWGPDNDQLLFTSGFNLVIKTVQLGRKDILWKAHEGAILCLDWNPINQRIISGGEDRTVRVWDAFGRQLYVSSSTEYVITSLAWCPNGETFAIGSYNMLRLCDKTGWSYSREHPSCGSLMDIAWASDSTQLVGAGGNGATVFAQLTDRNLTWNKLDARLVNPHKIYVTDAVNETLEEIDFARDRVIEMSIGYSYMVVCTATQCFIYHTNNWNTPHIFDLRATVNLIIQSEVHFLTVDNFHGIQIYTYEGKLQSVPKFPGMHPEFMNHLTVALSIDTLSILDHGDRKTIRLFDTTTSKLIAGVLNHNLEIVEISLSCTGPMEERKIFFIDHNRDLYIARVHEKTMIKLHGQVDTAAWNETCELLVAIADQRLILWMYPNMVFIDPTLVEKVIEMQDGSNFLKLSRISNFEGSNVSVRRADGALLAATIPPYASMLYEYIANNNWEKGVRFCRYVKSNTLWTCLAGMALYRRHLETAEIALAAIECVDKLFFILHVKSIRSEERRNAELALYSGKIEEAEAILLQAHPKPLVYRALKMNIRLFRWVRALELAIQYTTESSTHVDTVLAYRERFLKASKLQETDPLFLQYAKQVEIDWEKVGKKKTLEREKEQSADTRH